MANKVKTTKIGGGADYAKVADRLKVFWEENPNGKIDSERENLTDGKIRFIARIWRDQTEILKLAQAGTTTDVIKMTANATASADAVKKGDKENEKLETVAVGRALAMLGYLASGEVASREEMEEFENYKEEQRREIVESALDDLDSARSIDQLRNIFIRLDQRARYDKSVIAKKDEFKEKLSAATAAKPVGVSGSQSRNAGAGVQDNKEGGEE
jgi:hypothetical protein